MPALIAAFAAAAMALAVNPDEYSPLLPAPNGKQTNGSKLLAVSPKLRFSLTPGSGSEYVTNATERYARIMFAWGSQVDCSAGPAADQGRRTAAPCVTEVMISVANTSQELQLGVDESYTLTVGADAAVQITAPAVWGAMHALETLSQLVVWGGEGAGYQLANAPWSIVDEPRFPHRGLLIDSARHFLSVATIKRQIDAASYSKLNTIHWHVTDAESMPFVSTAFPSLAAKGVFAPGDPRFVYSPTQVADIIAYAGARGVRVMPEFDMPGAQQAALLSRVAALRSVAIPIAARRPHPARGGGRSPEPMSPPAHGPGLGLQHSSSS